MKREDNDPTILATSAAASWPTMDGLEGGGRGGGGGRSGIFFGSRPFAVALSSDGDRWILAEIGSGTSGGAVVGADAGAGPGTAPMTLVTSR